MSWKHRSSPGEGFTWRDSRTAGERVVLEVGPPPPPARPQVPAALADTLADAPG